MEIRQSSFNFPRLSDTGPQTAQATISFPRPVLRAVAGLAGYAATFEGDDHHLGRVTIELSTEISAADDTQVIVTGKLGLRDWSNEWDDDYSGNIQYVLLADLVGVAPPLPGDPRGDLIIVDAEFTQVIQHFRSDRHLDSANVFPDNSIRLIADKPTVVRLYVDYDAGSGLAVIASLSGTIEVLRGGTTDTLTPIENITPRRDSQVERGMRQHTLNVIIPEEMCRGDITIRARVSDAADATQFSRTFERTLSFDTIPALPIIAVGINYTGPDVNDDATPATLAAPQPADFVDTLELTEQLFPIPQVSITSFVTMDYDEEVESDINEGCDKLDDLLDAVLDMRGDSEDIVFGLYNTGVKTGSVGGCGGGGGAVGRNGREGTAAHELGHALGRQHAPCDNVTRCATPADTDSSYPVYSGYDSDSIGEYGVNTGSGAVQDPAVAHDIMGYSSNKWISPYTYKALMSRVPDTFGAAAGAAAASESGLPQRRFQDRGDWIKLKQPRLFLNMAIDRTRSVKLKPAFHFLAYPQAHGHKRTDFVAELQDENGNALKHACLFASDHGRPCGCAHGLWPLKIRQAISFHPKAVRLLIYECDKVVYEQAIPAPPTVRLTVSDADNLEQKTLGLQWQALAGGGDEKALWYLVQWRDARGTWRGCAARTQKTSLRVPKALFGRQQAIALRVLASSGIATGEGLWEGTLRLPPRETGRDLRISLVGVAAGATGSLPVPPFLRMAVSGFTGALAERQYLRWYDSQGAEIGRGRTLDLRTLRRGFHAVRAVALDTGQGTGSATWAIEHTRSGQFVLHLGKAADTTTKE